MSIPSQQILSLLILSDLNCVCSRLFSLSAIRDLYKQHSAKRILNITLVSSLRLLKVLLVPLVEILNLYFNNFNPLQQLFCNSWSTNETFSNSHCNNSKKDHKISFYITILLFYILCQLQLENFIIINFFPCYFI